MFSTSRPEGQTPAARQQSLARRYEAAALHPEERFPGEHWRLRNLHIAACVDCLLSRQQHAEGE